MSILVLKAHRDAAKAALSRRYDTLDEAAAAVAAAVVEAQGHMKWVIITKHGSGVVAYGPYGAAKTARKAAASGLMVGQQYVLLAMQPVPRSGHRDTQQETGDTQ